MQPWAQLVLILCAVALTVALVLAVLALRGALYPLSENPYWLVSVPHTVPLRTGNNAVPRVR